MDHVVNNYVEQDGPCCAAASVASCINTLAPDRFDPKLAGITIDELRLRQRGEYKHLIDERSADFIGLMNLMNPGGTQDESSRSANIGGAMAGGRTKRKSPPKLAASKKRRKKVRFPSSITKDPSERKWPRAPLTQNDVLSVYRDLHPKDLRLRGINHKTLKPRPVSTGGVGNSLLVKCINELSSAFGFTLAIRVFMGSAVSQRNLPTGPPLIILAKNDTDKMISRQWRQLTDFIDRAHKHKFLLYHAKNHYAPIYGYRSWTHETGGEKKIVRQVLYSGIGQQPKTWRTF